MKKLNAKRLAALAMTLVMLLGVLTACGDKADTNNGSGDGEGFPTMTIQIAHVNPTTDDDQYNKLATLFAEKVTAATDGAVTFEICGNSELGGEADVLTGFDLGTHQMGIITNGSYGNLYGPSLVVELPFIFKDNETAWILSLMVLMTFIAFSCYMRQGAGSELSALCIAPCVS